MTLIRVDRVGVEFGTRLQRVWAVGALVKPESMITTVLSGLSGDWNMNAIGRPGAGRRRGT